MKMLIEMYKVNNIKWELSSQHIAYIIDEKSTESTSDSAFPTKKAKSSGNINRLISLFFAFFLCFFNLIVMKRSVSTLAAPRACQFLRPIAAATFPHSVAKFSTVALSALKRLSRLL
jgi:hypothetical protein